MAQQDPKDLGPKRTDELIPGAAFSPLDPSRGPLHSSPRRRPQQHLPHSESSMAIVRRQIDESSSNSTIPKKRPSSRFQAVRPQDTSGAAARDGAAVAPAASSRPPPPKHTPQPSSPRGKPTQLIVMDDDDDDEFADATEVQQAPSSVAPPQNVTPNAKLMEAANRLVAAKEIMSPPQPTGTQSMLPVTKEPNSVDVSGTAAHPSVSLHNELNLPRFIFVKVLMAGLDTPLHVKLPIEAPLQRVIDHLNPTPAQTRTTFNPHGFSTLDDGSFVSDTTTVLQVPFLARIDGEPPEGVTKLGTLIWGRLRLDPAKTPFYYRMPDGTDVTGPPKEDVIFKFRHSIEDEEEKFREHIVMLQERGRFALLEECTSPKVFVAVAVLPDEPADVQNEFYFSGSPSRGSSHATNWRPGVFVMKGATYRIFHVPLFAPLEWLSEFEEGFPRQRDASGALVSGTFFALHEYAASQAPRFVPIASRRMKFGALAKLQETTVHHEQSNEPLGVVLARKRRLASYLDPSIPLVEGESTNHESLVVRLPDPGDLSVPSRDISVFIGYSSQPPLAFVDTNSSFCDAASSVRPTPEVYRPPISRLSDDTTEQHGDGWETSSAYPGESHHTTNAISASAVIFEDGAEGDVNCPREAMAIYRVYLSSTSDVSSFLIRLGVDYDVVQNAILSDEDDIGVDLTTFTAVLARIAAMRYPAHRTSPHYQLSMFCTSLKGRLYLL